jgi:predicted kinase
VFTRTLFERSRQVVDQRFSVILDAAFSREAERAELSAEARKMKADFRPVFLTADLAIRLARTASRTHDASDATSEVAAQQESYRIGQLDWPIVDASGSPEQTLEQSLTRLLSR